MLCLIHELLSNKGQILGKRQPHQMYYLDLIPLLHSTFFTLTLISPLAINKIYHWHQLETENGGQVIESRGARAMVETWMTAV